MRFERAIKYAIFLLGFMALLGYGLHLSIRILQPEESSLSETKKVVAKVNGRPIYEDQLQREAGGRLTRFRNHGMQSESPDLIMRLRGRALDKLIGNELLSQEARKLKIEDIDQRVKDKLSALETKHGSRERVEEYLKLGNPAMKSLGSYLRERVYLEEYLKEEGISEPPIPEARIRKFYESKPGNYRGEETIEVSHVLIAVAETAGAEEQQQARREAEDVRREILAGKDFAEMARKHSDCNSASRGGGLGYIKKGYMPKEFDGVAFSVKKNAVSDVVKTRFGYHIIKLSDKKPAGIVPYEEVKDFIRKFLQRQESKKKLEARIAELRKKAKIEILLDQSDIAVHEDPGLPEIPSGAQSGQRSGLAVPPQVIRR